MKHLRMASAAETQITNFNDVSETLGELVNDKFAEIIQELLNASAVADGEVVINSTPYSVENLRAFIDELAGTELSLAFISRTPKLTAQRMRPAVLKPSVQADIAGGGVSVSISGTWSF